MKPFDASWRVPAHACAANFRGYRACRNNIQLTEIRYRVTISLPFHLRYRAARKESKWTPSLPSSPCLVRFFVETRIRPFRPTRDHRISIYSPFPRVSKNSFLKLESIVLLVITRRTGRFIRIEREEICSFERGQRRGK